MNEAKSERRFSVMQVVQALAMAMVLSLLGLRVMRYLPVAWPEPVDAWLGDALVFAWYVFVWPLLYRSTSARSWCWAWRHA